MPLPFESEEVISSLPDEWQPAAIATIGALFVLGLVAGIALAIATAFYKIALGIAALRAAPAQKQRRRKKTKTSKRKR